MVHRFHCSMLLFAFAWCVTLLVEANTYYCSPNGMGNGSSYQAPCSFSTGINKVSQPGDTLYVLGGQYDLGNVVVSNKSGSRSRYLVISGYPGEKAILDFRTTPYGTRGLQIKSSCSSLCVRDLTLRYSGKNNLFNEGSYCLFENLDIYGSADTGCQMKTGGNNIIRNCDSHDNFDYKTGGLTAANFGGNADGFADKQHSGAPNHYIGCRSWNNADDGWDFYQRVTTGATIIEHCICYMNGPKEYDMRNHPRYNVDKTWFDQFTNGQQVKDRYKQQGTVTLEHYTNWGNGNGFKLGGDSTNHNVKVIQCLSVGNSVRGFDQNSNSGEMTLLNNTGMLNKPDYGFSTSCGTLTIQNCLSYQSKGNNGHRSQTTKVDSYNSWNISGLNLTNNDFLSTDTSLILQARMADGSLSDSLLLHPRSTSSIIDKGTPVNLKYYGSAPDLGCYEYEVGVPTLPEEEKEDTLTTYKCKEGSHKIAFVSQGGCAEDKPLLDYLRANDSLCIEVLDASENRNDYSSYEVIVIGAKPSSSSAAFPALKGYNKPILVLKPFLFKNTVWNWGTPINTQDVSITVSEPSHPIFTGITLNGQQQVALFSQCNTNAVTAMSSWSEMQPSYVALATPVSQSTYTNMADIAPGTIINGTTIKQRLVMVGVSEYSTLYLTFEGKKIIENAIYYLLGISPIASGTLSIVHSPTISKRWTPRGIIITRENQQYDILGKLLHNK